MKPMIYKLTGTWGNHEGSMLLWVGVLALSGGAARCVRAPPSRNAPWARRWRCRALSGWVSHAFLLLSSNPV